MRHVSAFRLSPADSARLHQALGNAQPAPRRYARLLLAAVVAAAAALAIAAAGIALRHIF
ncbi:hypothetical protein H0E84_08880 [Luteimonas sp. SJ-92]|uniref:Uncharacterized protein n=1 Tax=Luteimonas salinisoli TaxID=2752307 RepID=A0A853JD01_9GAMM|nr:hypothetical protein [Luteimonas salinisoli]NZA26499.1 hypothetical protein [Luteimonas salinisoli]